MNDRTLIAAMCLQGLLSNPANERMPLDACHPVAVKHADALLAECGEGNAKTPISDATADKFDIGNTYTIEPHGDGYALYRGRGKHHGMNLAHITEALPETLNLIASALNQPRKIEVTDDLVRQFRDEIGDITKHWLSNQQCREMLTYYATRINGGSND